MKMAPQPLTNPFRPGAGHKPPYLAGRETEKDAFKQLLKQEVILSNLIVTGLRGVGKTVLLEELKPIAIKEKWAWVGTDLSESTSVSEETIINRLLADLSAITSSISIGSQAIPKGFGFSQTTVESNVMLDYYTLLSICQKQPGLAADKLKAVLEFVWGCMSKLGSKGVIFAYDEAQTMTDHAETNQYPLSLILDVFQSIQRKGIPFMLVMAGLPILFPKLVQTRTYSERMFTVLTLTKLERKDSKDAILQPITATKECPITFSDAAVNLIIDASGGYPYFIQFICKEAFDIFQQQLSIGEELSVPMSSIIHKLDKNFFAGRWARATDRQRELLSVIAQLPNCDDEFSVQEIVDQSKKTDSPFSSSHVNQMLVTLGNAGLTYKNRHGRYAFAVPLLGQFIRRQEAEVEENQLSLPIPPSVG